MLPSVSRKAVICWISASKVIVCIQSAWDKKFNVDVYNHSSNSSIIHKENTKEIYV